MKRYEIGNESRAAYIAQALESSGCSVFWTPKLPKMILTAEHPHTLATIPPGMDSQWYTREMIHRATNKENPPK